MATVTAQKTWFLNADRSAAVGEDSPDAAFLLVRAGGEVEEGDLDKYGLTADAGAKRGEVEEGDLDKYGLTADAGAKRGEVEEGDLDKYGLTADAGAKRGEADGAKTEAGKSKKKG